MLPMPMHSQDAAESSQLEIPHHKCVFRRIEARKRPACLRVPSGLCELKPGSGLLAVRDSTTIRTDIALKVLRLEVWVHGVGYISDSRLQG